MHTWDKAVLGTQHSGGEPNSSSQEVIYRKVGSLSLGQSLAQGSHRILLDTEVFPETPGRDPVKDWPQSYTMRPGLLLLRCYQES